MVKEMNELHKDENSVTINRLTQSWNGFPSINSEPNDDLHADFTPLEMRDRPGEKKAILFSCFERTKQESTQPKKLLKMPKSFPGVKPTELSAQKTEPVEKELVEKAETKLTMDDLEKVLTPRREKNAGIKTRSGEKLPKIKITKDRSEVLNERKSEGRASPQAGSHAFNCARMLTELNEVCSLKSAGSAGKSEENLAKGENLLKLKTVHEARRYSAFTPRNNRSRFNHTRCKSMPNISSREFPKRFFVKLDPFRASATQVNLSSWNDTSRRCRMLSENLHKLDKQGIEPSQEQRNLLIGQWIRETSQVDFSYPDYEGRGGQVPSPEMF